jgi:hypothetical protein
VVAGELVDRKALPPVAADEGGVDDDRSGMPSPAEADAELPGALFVLMTWALVLVEPDDAGARLGSPTNSRAVNVCSKTWSARAKTSSMASPVSDFG